MLMYAMAPSKVQPPELFAKWTYVTELKIDWASIGGIDRQEIGLLARMVNIQREADALKQRAAKRN